MKTSKLIALVLSLVAILCIFAGCGNTDDKPAGDDAAAKATIILVLEDKTEIKHEIDVKDGQTLREALYAAKLIDDENNVSVFVNTIDGHTADAINDGVTWLVFNDKDEQLQSEVADAVCIFDGIKVKAGATYKVVYTVVPSFEDD